MSFLQSSIDWFSGRRVAHMGPFQYAAHKGMRDGQSMSGAYLWAKAEAERIKAHGNMVCAEGTLLRKVAQEIGAYVPHGTAVIDLGPGTTSAFTHKTLPLATSLESENCILVDESRAFLQRIAGMALGDIDMRLVVDDFFSNEHSYWDRPALVCSFGSTISNIINPASSILPHRALSQSLVSFAKASPGGWMLVGFDSDQDGQRIQQYFQKHSDFQLNIFDRMAAELPMEGYFDAAGFAYETQWISESGQLAHLALAKQDMNFAVANTQIKVLEGQRLHIKNSYKFRSTFFEECCDMAGLEVVASWSDHSPAKIYLLKIPETRSALAKIA